MLLSQETTRGTYTRKNSNTQTVKFLVSLILTGQFCSMILLTTYVCGTLARSCFLRYHIKGLREAFIKKKSVTFFTLRFDPPPYFPGTKIKKIKIIRMDTI